MQPLKFDLKLHFSYMCNIPSRPSFRGLQARAWQTDRYKYVIKLPVRKPIQK